MPWISRVEPNPARSDQVLLTLSEFPPHIETDLPPDQAYAPGPTIVCHRDDALGLTEGMELSDARALALEHSLPRRECREKALSLLARREHAERELQRKLMQRRFAPDVITEVCAELKYSGLLDDQRFVSSWISAHRGRRPRGLRFLAAEFADRGVSPEDFSQARDALLAEEPGFEEQECRAAIARVQRTGGSTEKTRRTLQRWGFTHATILSVENSLPGE